MMDGAVIVAPAGPALSHHVQLPQPNQRQKAKALTRQKVLDAAERLFSKVGYKAATIRDIAADAGMSTGAVFNSFDDKDALYLAIYGHPALTPEQGLELAAALRRAVEFLEGFEDDPFQVGLPDLLADCREILPSPTQAAVTREAM